MPTVSTTKNGFSSSSCTKWATCLLKAIIYHRWRTSLANNGNGPFDMTSVIMQPSTKKMRGLNDLSSFLICFLDLELSYLRAVESGKDSFSSSSQLKLSYYSYFKTEFTIVNSDQNIVPALTVLYSNYDTCTVSHIYICNKFKRVPDTVVVVPVHRQNRND